MCERCRGYCLTRHACWDRRLCLRPDGNKELIQRRPCLLQVCLRTITLHGDLHAQLRNQAKVPGHRATDDGTCNDKEHQGRETKAKFGSTHWSSSTQRGDAVVVAVGSVLNSIHHLPN